MWISAGWETLVADRRIGIVPPDLWTELARPMPHSKGLPRFKSRREAEQALAEIIEDGGKPADFRIDDLPEGGCVITVLEDDGRIAGTLSA